jgi:hypothetical protein
MFRMGSPVGMVLIRLRPRQARYLRPEHMLGVQVVGLNPKLDSLVNAYSVIEVIAVGAFC